MQHFRKDPDLIQTGLEAIQLAQGLKLNSDLEKMKICASPIHYYKKNKNIATTWKGAASNQVLSTQKGLLYLKYHPILSETTENLLAVGLAWPVWQIILRLAALGPL